MVIDQKIVQGIEKENLTIGKLLDVVTSLYPNVEAAIFDHLRKTWTQFKEDVDKFALGLLGLGIQKGEKAGVWALNIYEWMVAWFALPKIGVILIPMDHWYQDNEAEYVLNHSEAVACICTSNYVNRLNGFRSKVPAVRFVILMDDPSPTPTAEGLTTMKKIMSPPLTLDSIAKLENLQNSINKHDVTFILYTSGTTGVPKGAMLTHFNIIKNCVATATVLACSPNDKYLIPVPFSHCFGCILGITLATLTGSPMIPLKDQDPVIAIKKIGDEKATVAHGTPTHFVRYIRYIKETNADTSCLRTGIIAGAPCPPPVLRDIIDIMKIPDIVIGYGLTEASPIVTLTKPDDSFENRIGSVGKAIPDIEVRIVDEDNQPLGPGEDGELVVRGYNVMKGYFKAPDQTAKAIDKDGWLHTGDMAQVDKEGYYKITGRIKDMIIYGGANVYPKMVEDYLIQNKEILEVAVVGVPDEEYGELVAAVIKKAPDSPLTEQDVVDFCYGNISSPSVPRYVLFNVDIPLSGRGKVQKYKLRKDLSEKLKKEGLGKKLVPTKAKAKKA
jgi:acyl-CoA synthetase (AMP-forming)/AMP-acid ligase II